MTNPKIGKLEENQYPSQLITGKPYQRSETDPPPTIVHDLGEGYVAIGDMFPPAGFDIEAALDVLKAELAPKASGKKATEKASES
jgi:hypothetical protein